MVALVGAIVAGAALIGGTFASWIVTDNADPLGIKITPIDIAESETERVTLEWGDKTGFTNIGSIGISTSVKRSVGLLATYTGNAFSGNLSAELTTTSSGAHTLIEYLDVEVYDKDDKDAEGATKILEIGHHLTTPTYSDNADIAVNSGTELTVSFYFKLNSAITPQIYEEVKNDFVLLTIDWNKGSAIAAQTEKQTYYFEPISDYGSAVYAYAWDSVGGVNAAWPGVQMTKVKDAALGHQPVYACELEIKDPAYTHIIFNNGVHENSGDNKQTVDLELPDLSEPSPTPFYQPYDNHGWIAAPSFDPEPEPDYYVTGTMNDWNTTDATYKLVANTYTGEDTIPNSNILFSSFDFCLLDVDIAANTYIKVAGTDGSWYGEFGTGSDNFRLGEAHHYDFFFSVEGEAGTVNSEAKTVFVACRVHS